MYLWIKAFHVIFMVTWFAGLFYLPRLFVYHAEASDAVGRDRFKTMEKRLSILMSIAAVATIVFGIWLIGMLGWGWFVNTGWIHAKIALVLLLVGFHGWCQAQVKKFREDRATGSPRYFRLMNEVPTIFLVTIVVLAIVKPF